MDNTTYVALSQLTALERQIDVTANNIANVNSHGFKAERVLFESYLQQDGQDPDQGTNYVIDKGSYLDTGQGTMTRTDNPLDIALSGSGWFGYQIEGGQTAYGRDGRLALDPDGRLITLSGAQLLDEGGGPIVLPPDVAGTMMIGDDGTISTPEGLTLARIGVFDLGDLQSFERVGNGMFVPPDGQADRVPAEGTRVLQGNVEGSNGQAVTEVTRLIGIQQAYQRAVNLLNSEDELKKNLLGRIGRPQI